MTDSIAALFIGIPKWLAVFILSAAPVGELRVALPLAVTVWHMRYFPALFWSVAGSFIPVFLIYGVGNAWLTFIDRREGFWKRTTHRIVHHTRNKYKDRDLSAGLVAIAVMVGMPVPLIGGVWTGTLVAFLFGIPLRRAFLPITFGIFGMAAIVSGFIVGAKAVF